MSAVSSPTEWPTLVNYSETPNTNGQPTMFIYVVEGRFKPLDHNCRRLSAFLSDATAASPPAIPRMRTVLNLAQQIIATYEELRRQYRNHVFPFISGPTTKDGAMDEAQSVFVGQSLDLGLNVIMWCAAEIVRHDNNQRSVPSTDQQTMTIIAASAPLASPFSRSR